MRNPRKARRLRPQKDAARSRVYRQLPVKSDAFLIKGTQLFYNSRGRSIPLDIKRASIAGLPRSPDLAIRSVFREMQGARADIHRRLFVPVASRFDKTLDPQAQQALMLSLQQNLSDLEDLLLDRVTSVIEKESSREIKELLLDMRQDFGHTLSFDFDSLIRQTSSARGSIGLRSRDYIRQALVRAEHDIAKRISLDYSRERLNRIRGSLYGSHHVPSSGRCLSKGLSRIMRTQTQSARHEAAYRTMKAEGVRYAYWRLSSSHRDYGGSEICEIFANSTGRSVPDDIGLDRRGLYSLDEIPSPPHPNCLCSIEVASF
jgi:hypothetical protein